MSTVALFSFGEVFANVRPADQAGNAKDLSGDTAATPDLAMPDVVVSLTGRGRKFGANIGLIAKEAVADSLRLTRDCTVRAFLRYRIDNAVDGARGTVVARGKSGSNPERVLFGLELERVSSTVARVRAVWQEADGTPADVDGATFVCDPAQFYELAVVRRWENTAEVLVTYLVNGQAIGQETVVEGDLGEGEDGTLIIGAQGSGVDYQRFLPTDTILDSVSIESDAMTQEEVRQEFRRITVHQPNGYRILKSYVPPGKTYSTKPESRFQRWLAAEGDGLGFVIAKAEQLREDFLPDRAYGGALEAWERITRQAPGPRDSVEQRRARVLGYLRKTQGFQVGDLREALEPLFGIEADDVEIIEFTGLRQDLFATDDISTPPSSLWLTNQGNGVVSIAGGKLVLEQAAGDDTRWQSGGAPRREVSLGKRLGGSFAGANLLTKQEITSLGYGPDTVFGHVWRTSSSDMVFVGILDKPTDQSLVWFQIVSGVRSAAVTLLSGPSVDLFPSWLLTRFVGNNVFGWEVSQVSEAALTGNVATFTASLPEEPHWAGVAIISLSALANDDATIELDFARIFELQNPRGFGWIAYRDPGLGGTYDLRTAQAQIDKQGPSHGAGAALDDVRGYLAGTGLVGVHPIYPHGA